MMYTNIEKKKHINCVKQQHKTTNFRSSTASTFIKHHDGFNWEGINMKSVRNYRLQTHPKLAKVFTNQYYRENNNCQTYSEVFQPKLSLYIRFRISPSLLFQNNGFNLTNSIHLSYQLAQIIQPSYPSQISFYSSTGIFIVCIEPSVMMA